MRYTLRVKKRVLLVVAVLGVPLLFALGFLGYRLHSQETVNAFLHDYRRARDIYAQEKVAAKYLEELSVAELNAAIEEEYPQAVCHVQGHGIGRAVYAREQNFASSLALCGNHCNSGCFHGVIMGMFKTKSDTLGGAVEEEDSGNYIRYVTDRAQEICADPEVASLVLPTVCWHGVGHVFATASDLKTAVESCSVFKKTGIGASICAGGAFMEYGKQPENAGALMEAGLAFCDDFPALYASQCYRYIASVMVRKYGGFNDAFRKCEAYPDAKRRACIFGIAFYALEPRDFMEPDGPDRVCGMLTDTGDKDACVEGGLWELANRTGATQGDPVCGDLHPVFREQCHARIERQQAIE